MLRLDAFSGRLSLREYGEAADFVRRLDRQKGLANSRRAIQGKGERTSRIRAKAAEIFVAKLLLCPVDLAIRAGGDGGVDTRFRGHWCQIKRAGTRKAKRGEPWFRLELNDPTAKNPPWDIGIMVEDDPDDDRVFALAGWITRRQWVRERRYVDWRPKPAWVVSDLRAPGDLLDLHTRNPYRRWPR